MYKILLAILALLLTSASALSLQRNEESHEGKYAWFTFNEELTGGKCKTFNQCDGRRVCVSGQCKGLARLPKRPEYTYNEALNEIKCPTDPTDPNYTNRDYFCDGNRKCSATGSC